MWEDSKFENAFRSSLSNGGGNRNNNDGNKGEDNHDDDQIIIVSKNAIRAMFRDRDSPLGGCHSQECILQATCRITALEGRLLLLTPLNWDLAQFCYNYVVHIQYTTS